MKFVTVLADSLAMPNAQTTYSDLYPFKLSQLLGKDFHIINRARRNNTMVEQTRVDGVGWLIEDVTYSGMSSYFVVHIGIVDAAPRLFLQGEFGRWKKLGRIGSAVVNYKIQHRAETTKRQQKTYVSREGFERAARILLESIVQKTKVQLVLLLNIADTSPQNKEKSFGFERNIKDYNAILSRVAATFHKVEMVDVFSMTSADPSLLLEDGIHLAGAAHDLIAGETARLIQQTEREKYIEHS